MQPQLGYYQLNMWGYGPNNRSLAHIRNNKVVLPITCIQPLSKEIEELPENTSFNIVVAVIRGNLLEAQILGLANEFEMNEERKRHFKGLGIELELC